VSELSAAAAEARRPFEWEDGPLVVALRRGDWILVDELNLAEDAVIERLNRYHLAPCRKAWCTAAHIGIAWQNADELDQHSATDVSAGSSTSPTYMLPLMPVCCDAAQCAGARARAHTGRKGGRWRRAHSCCTRLPHLCHHEPWCAAIWHADLVSCWQEACWICWLTFMPQSGNEMSYSAHPLLMSDGVAGCDSASCAKFTIQYLGHGSPQAATLARRN
jgi:hypothetical protein